MRSSAASMPVAVVGLMASAGIALAQVPVGGDGRLLDANPALGGYRYNTARPVSPLLNGNFLAEGNARFGQSLRISSPVGSPATFSGGLPSAGLSSFTRDSFSVGDYYGGVGRSLNPTLYYDPQQTAPTAGFLLGRQGAGAPTYTNTAPVAGSVRLGNEHAYSVNRGPYSSLPGLLDYSAPADPRRQPQIDPQDFSRSLRADRPELSSSIFGMASPRVPGPLTPEQLGPGNWQPPPSTATENNVSVWRPIQFQTPVERAEIAAAEAAASPLDRLTGRDIRSLLTQGLESPSPTARALTPERPGATGADVGALAARAKTGLLGDPSMLPGQDVFTDMQLALSLQSDPGADWFTEMQNSIRGNPTLAQETLAVAEQKAGEFVDRVLTVPVRTFVGAGKNEFNNEMLKAEAFMEVGQFYDAAKRFEQARRIEPANPLPLVGKAHALLAAGEYMSAAASLILGLERFPELAKMTFDLHLLLGGAATVDVRRSDLSRQLERGEELRLRFLLGYLELHSGNRDFALENLDQAANDAPIGSIIRRYPDMVRGVGLLPPRKLEPQQPPLDEAEAETDATPGE